MYISRVAVAGYFYLHFADEPSLALAEADHDTELGRLVRTGGQISDWDVLRLELGEGVVVDYLANTFAFRLCSQRLRDVIDRSLSALDVVQWLPVVVKDREQTELPYWVLHFPEAPSVINMSKSVLYFPDPKVVASRPVVAMDSPTATDPVVVKACLDANLVANRRVFGFPKDSIHLVVAGDVKNEIQRAECTGMTFSKVPVG